MGGRGDVGVIGVIGIGLVCLPLLGLGAGAGGLGWLGLPALGRAAGCGLVCSEVGLRILMVPGEVVVSPFSLGLLSGVVNGSGWAACEFLLE